MALSHYAELWCLSNFSFLHGASHPEELVERANELGYSALALTDDCSMAGIVRAHVAAKEVGLKLLIGAQFKVEHTAPFTFIVLARNLQGYGNLCEFITSLRRSADKGTYRLTFGHLAKQRFEDCLVLLAPPRGTSPEHLATLTEWLQASFEDRCWLVALRERVLGDEMWLHQLRQAADAFGVPVVAGAMSTCTCAHASRCRMS